MADEQTRADGGGGQGRSVGQKLKRTVEKHVVVPLAVTVVSAATHYLIKKLPLILEEKVLPKLREQAGAEGVRAAVAETAASVGEKVADVVPSASEDGDKGGADEGGDDAGGDDAGAAAQPAKRRQSSDDEREQERQRREERRGERRRAVQKA